MELIRNKLNTNNRILRENLGSEADRQTDRPGERWTRQTDKQTDRRTDRRIDGQVQKHRQTCGEGEYDLKLETLATHKLFICGRLMASLRT